MSEEYLSLTEIGRLYGVSSHTVGKWLKDLCLRTEDGRPSRDAFHQGYVSQRPSRVPGTYFYVWHAGKTTAILDMMEYRRAKVEDVGGNIPPSNGPAAT
jgi:hypothetical protein